MIFDKSRSLLELQLIIIQGKLNSQNNLKEFFIGLPAIELLNFI